MSAGTQQRRSPMIAAVFLILLMAIGSVVMWIGIPLGLVYLASIVSNSSEPSLGPYMIIIIGLPIGMIIIGKALASLDRRYAALMAVEEDRARVAPWLRSMRGERESGHRTTVLDRVMIVSVTLAGIAFAIWFFGFAGSSLPGA